MMAQYERFKCRSKGKLACWIWVCALFLASLSCGEPSISKGNRTKHIPGAKDVDLNTEQGPEESTDLPEENSEEAEGQGSNGVMNPDKDISEDPSSGSFEDEGKTLEEIEQDVLGEVNKTITLKENPTVGFRNFDQINATYSALTGVPSTDGVVARAFSELRANLPTTNEISSITSGQVSSYLKLASFYCDVAMNDFELRTAILGDDFDFALPPQQAFANPDAVVDSILNKFFRPGYSNLNEAESDRTMLKQLLAEIIVGKDNTRNVAMGLCTAVLSSAGVTVY